jgi:hypothetical protein
MNLKTETILNKMLETARAGHDVYPFMFQPIMGRSNSVSAAIREGKKRGLLIEAGKDGVGKPFYRAAMPAATHVAPETAQ